MTNDRREFLKRMGAISTIPILGTVAVQNAQQLVLPSPNTNKPPEIVLATTTLPEPIGSIEFEWARVMVSWESELMQNHRFSDPFPSTPVVAGGYAQIIIEGFAFAENVQRSKEYFRIGNTQQKVRIYLAKA